MSESWTPARGPVRLGSAWLCRSGRGSARRGQAWRGVARTAYTAVRVCGAHAWRGRVRHGCACQGQAGRGYPWIGTARQGIGRTACTQVRALGAHARLGFAGQCIAGRGTGSAGRGMAWQGGRATSRPQGASPWCPRTAGRGQAARGKVRPVGARPGLAWRGTAVLGAAGNFGWPADTEMRVLGARAVLGSPWHGAPWHGTCWPGRGNARQRWVRQGVAGPGKAVLGTARTVGRAAHPQGSSPWLPRMARRGETRPGRARPGEANGLARQGNSGGWQASRFEPSTPTQGEAGQRRGSAWLCQARRGLAMHGAASPGWARRCQARQGNGGRVVHIGVRVSDAHVRGAAWQCLARPGVARLGKGVAGYWQTRRFESCGPTEGQRNTSPGISRDRTPAQHL